MPWQMATDILMSPSHGRIRSDSVEIYTLLSSRAYALAETGHLGWSICLILCDKYYEHLKSVLLSQ